MEKLHCEDQWQAWRIGRDCHLADYTLEAALNRLTATFQQPEQRLYFDAGFAGKQCPGLTAPNPE